MVKWKIDSNGVKFIRSLEGCQLHSYRDIAGVWTIGVGHTGDDVHANMTISQARADELLKQDIASFEAAVNGYVTIPLNQNQYNALVSFAFNIGGTAFRNSTLLKLLNKGDYQGAAAQFDVWNKARDPKTGQLVVSRGLQNRRDAEQKLFNTPMPKVVQTKPVGPTYYTVVKGDNVSKIGARFKTTVKEIQRLNNLKNADLIYPGQRLRVH